MIIVPCSIMTTTNCAILYFSFAALPSPAKQYSFIHSLMMSLTFINPAHLLLLLFIHQPPTTPLHRQVAVIHFIFHIHVFTTLNNIISIITIIIITLREDLQPEWIISAEQTHTHTHIHISSKLAPKQTLIRFNFMEPVPFYGLAMNGAVFRQRLHFISKSRGN